MDKFFWKLFVVRQGWRFTIWFRGKWFRLFSKDVDSGETKAWLTPDWWQIWTLCDATITFSWSMPLRILFAAEQPLMKNQLSSHKTTNCANYVQLIRQFHKTWFNKPSRIWLCPLNHDDDGKSKSQFCKLIADVNQATPHEQTVDKLLNVEKRDLITART